MVFFNVLINFYIIIKKYKEKRKIKYIFWREDIGRGRKI